MTSGVLRWRTRLDLAIDAQALKKKPTGFLRKALLIAAYQILIQDRTSVPQVVSETVDLVRGKDGEQPAKFANALLRRLAEQGDSWRKLARPGSAAQLNYRAAWAGLPEWWVKRLEKDHGTKWAMDFGEATLTRPQLWLHAKEGKAPSFSEKGPVPGAYSLPENSAAPKGSITAWPGFAEGDYFVQDLSSQILIHEVTAEIRSRVMDKRKLTVLDRCAAPGGKSAGLAWAGWNVIATDRVLARFPLLEETVRRVSPAVRVMTESDALKEKVDAIWIDAPCSGSGIIRRHPDTKWLRRESDLAALEKTQEQLLRDSYASLPSGGFLVYTVCSVFKSEGESVVEKAGLKPQLTREWRLAPHLEPSTDGFYGALFFKP